MQEVYSIPLSQLCEEFSLEKVYVPEHFEEIMITTPEISRPGLALAGFFEIFEAARVQIIGYAEYRYLETLPPEVRKQNITNYINATPVAVVHSCSAPVMEEMLEAAARVGVPLLRSQEKTSPLMASMIAALNNHLAPRITRHGVLVEVYGEGLLLLGDSGVGKSETAIELVKRGHRLIADDAVEIKRVSSKTLVGTAPDIIRHYVELRGIGIVDVRRLFGMGAVKMTERIDLIINLETWVQGKMYDRLGLDEETTNILGLEIPSITIPVKPGRNLAIILEIAAMNNRQKKMGYNAAHELLTNLGMDVSLMPSEEIKRDLDI